uniref:K Homology domain-containing protein n=1 Tax=Trichobilharzia regenti TaxID=157069 RepID=A0AA85K3D9_TRIRE|nr:unnamed protein product [Trichobilharzia regenti]
MIGIEVKGRLNQYIKAVLRNVINENAIVFYPEKNEEEQVPLQNVRLPPSSGSDIQPGQSGEVLFSVATDQTTGSPNTKTTLPCRWGDGTTSKPEIELVLDDNWDNLSIPSWWPCRVTKIRDDVAVVKLNVTAPADATPSEISLCTQLSAITDIVSRKILRQPSEGCPCLSPDDIHRHRIEIPKELAEFASDTSVHNYFLRRCGGPVSVYYDSESSSLVVLTTDPVTAKNVALLEDTHLRMLRQKFALTRSLRQTMRNLEVNRGPDVSRGGGGMKNSGDWNTDPSLYVEKFYVPQHLMGLAIGARGVNIRSAREIPNVVRISSWEPHEYRPKDNDPVDNAGDYGDSAMFVVEAKTQEAAKQARAKLEYTELYLGVPRRYVGRLIGKRTSNIMSIIRKSGLLHIHLDDHIDGPVTVSDDNNQSDLIKYAYPDRPTPTTMRRVFLKAGSTQTTSQPHSDEEFGGFILAGTRDSIEKARLLINFQMDYFYDLEKMESEKLELMRSLSHGSADAGPGYPPRGGAAGRWGDRGGGGGGVPNYPRGGRGRRPGRGGLLHPPMNANGGPNHSHYTDDENPIPYRGARRMPREMQGPRAPGGRVPRQGGGRSGGRRMGGPNRDSDWNAHASSNGDVADRRRGSQDSDVIESNNLPDGVSGDRTNGGGRHNRVTRPPPAHNGFYSDRERGDDSEDTPNQGDENNFPCGGDASSEDDGGCSVDGMRPRMNKSVHNRPNAGAYPPRRSRQSRSQKSNQWNTAKAQLLNNESSTTTTTGTGNSSQKSRVVSGSGSGVGSGANPSGRQQSTAQVYQE